MKKRGRKYEIRNKGGIIKVRGKKETPYIIASIDSGKKIGRESVILSRYEPNS